MKKLLVLMMLALFASIAFAQVAGYTFGYSTGTYTEITGGTVLATATVGGSGATSLDNNIYTGVPLPFNFAFNGRRYSQVAVNSNGYVVFGGTTSFPESNQIASTTTAEGLAVAYGKDNQGIVVSGSLGEIRYETVGIAPNREFVIQWKNFRDYSGTTDYINFQIRLTEANEVKFAYGSFLVTTTETCVVGLRGTANTDYNNRTTVSTWAGSAAGTANNATMAVSSSIYPANGSVYTFTPPAASAIPNVAINPNPANAATNVFTTSTISWSDGGGWTNGFKLYFGTTDPAPYVGDLGYVTSYDPPGDMNFLSTYYWKVVPYNAFGDNTTGTQWSFGTSSAPLTGVLQIGAGGDYATFTEAINALNGAGVGAGGVTFQVADGTYAENPPAITVGGSLANPIVFEAREGANPVLTPTGGTGTFAFKITGADYITFDNIDISAPNNLIYGYWISGISGNGATNITIKNCAITAIVGTSTTYGIRTDASDQPNSYLYVRDNVITNFYNGIYLTGSSTAGNEAQQQYVGYNSIIGAKNYGIYMGYTQNSQITYNNIDFFAGSTVAYYGIYTLGSTSTITASYNIIGAAGPTNTSSTVYGLYNSSGNVIYEYNEVHNLYNTSSSSWYGIYAGGGDTIWRYNVVSGIANTGTAAVYAVYLTTGNHNVYGNQIYDIATGGTSVYGMYIIGGTTHNIYNNKVYNLRYTGTSTGVVYGIHLASGTTNNVYNNMVYDLRNSGGTTAPQVRGLSITSGTTDNIWNNSIFLNSSGTAANYATAGIYITASTNTIDLRNNIVVNKSIPGSTGRSVALWKTTTGYTNIAATTDKNIYYCGEPSATTPIAYNSATAYNTLEDYKLAIATKDQASYTEDVPFLSSVSPYNLHIDPAITTRVEGNAIVIATVSTDIDGDARNATTPDIGADEGNFTAPQGAPGLVTLLSPADGATGINPITGTLSWSAPVIGGAVTEYWVYVATSLENIFSESFTTVALPATSLVLDNVEGLEVGFDGTYYWAVQAHNAEGESDAEDPAFQIWNFTTREQMEASTTLNIGNAWPSTRKNGTIPVQNLGTTPLTFTAVGSAEFEFEPTRFTIPASSTYNLVYGFNAPATTGAYTGSITLTQTSPGASSIEIAVTANISTDLTIGTGTTELMIPADPYFGYSYSQTIYYPTEISYPEGYRIERIKYYFNGYEQAELTKQWVIYMGHTTESTFATTSSWVPLTSLTQVYSGTQMPELVAGGYWMEFILDTPFIYNGTDNLVIGVEENFPGYDSSSSFFYSTATTGVNRSIRHTSDSVNADPAAPPTGTLVAGYPNTMFIVGEIPTVPTATVVPESWDFGTAVINTTNTKQFSIQNNGAGTLTISNISIAGDAPYTLTGLPTFPVNLTTGQNTTFTVQYLPIAAGDFTATVTVDSNVDDVLIPIDGACVDPRIATLPHIQNFDGVTTPALPLGWTKVLSSTSSSAYVQTTTTYPVSTPNSVYLTNSADAAANLVLVSPQVIPALNTMKVSFSARGSSAGYNLLVGTMDSPTGTFTQIQSVALTATHTVYTVMLTGYAGTDTYVAFKHALGGTYRSIYLDNITFELVLENDLAATSVNGPGFGIAGEEQQFSITVYNNGTQTQNAYNIHLKRYGDDRLASLPITTPIAPGATASYDISWTPTISGAYSLVGEVELTGDQSAANNESAQRAFQVYPEGTYIPIVGDVNTILTANSIPFNMYYKNNVAETIYLPHELQMGTGTIQAVMYQNNFTQDLTKPVKIWMKNTTEANLSTAWLPFDGYTLVFDGTVNFPLGVNIVVIPLTTPFNYTGGNLAVRTYRVWEDVYWNTTNHFYYNVSTGYPNRTRYYQADQTAAMDPILMLDYLGAPVAGTLTNNIPLTAFIASPYTPMTMATPVVTASMVGANVQLSWPAVAGASAYQVFSSNDPFVWGDTPDATVTTNSHTASIVAMKFYKVVAITSFRNVDLGLVANPSITRGIDNSRLISEPLIPMTEDKN